MPAECFSADGGHCVITASCRLKGALAEAVRAFYAVLDNYTLEDLSREALGEALPLAAWPDWLAGRPWGGAPHRATEGGFEQLGWQVPDVIFYPTGGGTGMIGMWKAFAEMEALGWIGARRPRMVAVQAEGCAPIVRAWAEGVEHATRWEDARTIAAGIRVPQAVGDFLILRAVRDSGGFAIAVSDAAIAAGVDEVARREGFLMCPEGGAVWAAYRQARADGRVAAGERVVLFNCASGIKYPLPRAEQRIDLGTALTAYTAGSAYVNHLDDTGQIRVGALADLAVLDRDPFAGKPDEIGATRVLQTFVDGQRVFAADDA